MQTDVEEIIHILESPSKEDTELIKKAHGFAMRAHDGQLRKSGEPYFVHVFETAKNLANFHMDAHVIAAGFLHDVLEDTEIQESKMRGEFGDDITNMVLAVTKLGTLKYKGMERNIENLRKFFIAMADDIRVLIIKLADRLHNIETLEHVSEEKQKRIAMETLEVYAPLANRLSMGKLKGRLEDAAFPYAYPKEYEEVKILRAQRNDLTMPKLEEVHKELIEAIDLYKIKVENIDYREKHLYSLWNKLKKRNMDINSVYDIIAMRVITNSIESCYMIMGIIHGLYKPLPGRIKDYIALPKSNGYRSLHTTIVTKSGAIIEIQIRTKEMHEEAEYGIAAHFIYKENNLRDDTRMAWVHELKEIQSKEDSKKFYENLRIDFFNDRAFVFTPKGDIINLPEEGTVLDFAFNVHSEIGMHAEAGEVNGKYAKLDHILKNGDVVKIITNKKVNPTSKWLSFTKSSIARKHIEKYLKDNSLLEKLKSFGKK